MFNPHIIRVWLAGKNKTELRAEGDDGNFYTLCAGGDLEYYFWRQDGVADDNSAIADINEIGFGDPGASEF